MKGRLRARASLEEVLEDFGDFLRTRGATLWEKDSREALFVRWLDRSQTSCGQMREVAR